MNKRLTDEINKQINYELYSAYFYLSMATYAARNDFPGFENWFLMQVKEENMHAMKFYDFVHTRGEKVVLKAIEQPPVEFESLLGVFEAGLKHEKFVTERINLLMSIALEEKDYAAVSFLNWYVDEQVEEEESFAALIGKIKIVGSAGMGLYQLDKEVASRTFTEPVAE